MLLVKLVVCFVGSAGGKPGIGKPGRGGHCPQPGLNHTGRPGPSYAGQPGFHHPGAPPNPPLPPPGPNPPGPKASSALVSLSKGAIIARAAAVMKRLKDYRSGV